MATLHETTASSTVEITDQEAVEDLFEKYRVTPGYRIEGDKLTVFGHNGFRAWEDDKKGKRKSAESEFLHKLRQYLTEDSELIIQTVGNEKCRFPLVAYQYKVISEGVFYSALGTDERKVEVNL